MMMETMSVVCGMESGYKSVTEITETSTVLEKQRNNTEAVE